MATQIINGVEVELTPDEEQELEEFWAANRAEKENRVLEPTAKEKMEALWEKIVNDDDSKVLEVQDKMEAAKRRTTNKE